MRLRRGKIGRLVPDCPLSAQTRVRNLLIDVVAQTGHFKPNATSLQNDFVVEGEEHYWVHLAIDRFTGKVLERQVEQVKE